MSDTTDMSDAETTAKTGTTPPTPTEDHDAGHGHGHAPTGEPLGPIDWTAWGYALAGTVMGLLIALALFVARGG